MKARRTTKCKSPKNERLEVVDHVLGVANYLRKSSLSPAAAQEASEIEEYLQGRMARLTGIEKAAA